MATIFPDIVKCVICKKTICKDRFVGNFDLDTCTAFTVNTQLNIVKFQCFEKNPVLQICLISLQIRYHPVFTILSSIK